MITIWGGYVAVGDARVFLVAFDGARIGGVSERNAQWTFYATVCGRVVVHEVRTGRRRGGRVYDQALVYVFDNLAVACAHLDVSPQRIDPARGDAPLPRVAARYGCGIV